MELNIGNRQLFADIETERTKKMASLCSDSSFAEKDLLAVLDTYKRREPEIEKALAYAKTLDFSKNHLRSSYLSHPIRLATFLVMIDPQIGTDYIVIALLHNVPETTSITAETLTELFGPTVGSGIKALVVDRKAVFAEIRNEYYRNIFAKGTSLVLVKLIDKIDNLFVLGLNADDAVRKEYIMEIREELLPFAREYDQQLGSYLERLLEDTAARGYSKELKDQLNQYQESIKP
ncbi:MAG: hypothetical protein JWO09_1002 [Bacteroidetes bacterium]|nr:hypothetical protein [Bacteroidota bacterium]